MAVVSDYTVKTRGIGLPDYAQPKPVGAVPIGPVHTLTDDAELAARLGSANVFDRQGNVIWFDDFEDGINKWDSTSDLVWSAEEARYGGYCGKMQTAPVAGASALASARRICFSVPGMFGFEFSFLHNGQLRTIYLAPTLYYGDHAYGPWIGWKRETNLLGYFDYDAVWHNLPSGENFYTGGIWHTIKLVVDGTTGRYVRLMVNNRTYVVTDRMPPMIFAPGTYYTQLFIEMETHFDSVLTTHIDGVIITQNEPPNPVE